MLPDISMKVNVLSDQDITVIMTIWYSPMKSIFTLDAWTRKDNTWSGEASIPVPTFHCYEICGQFEIKRDTIQNAQAIDMMQALTFDDVHGASKSAFIYGVFFIGMIENPSLLEWVEANYPKLTTIIKAARQGVLAK